MSHHHSFSMKTYPRIRSFNLVDISIFFHPYVNVLGHSFIMIMKSYQIISSFYFISVYIYF